MRKYFFLISLIFSLSSCSLITGIIECIGNGKPSQPVVPIVRTISVDGKKIFLDDNIIFIKGYGSYGMFFNNENYKPFLKLLSESGINYTRQWFSPLPRTWYPPNYKNLVHPFLEKNGRFDLSKLNENWIDHVHEIIDFGASLDPPIIFQVSYWDKVSFKYKTAFSGLPFNIKNGGYVTENNKGQGFPDFWNSRYDSETKEITQLYANVLKDHWNVIHEPMNEPGLGTDQEINEWHVKVSSWIKEIIPNALIMYSPRMLSNNYFVPDINDCDIVSAHGSGFLSYIPGNQPCYSQDEMKQKITSVVNSINKPVIIDDDGWHESSGCSRSDNSLVAFWRSISEETGASGFMHRDGEPFPPPDITDLNAIKIIGRNFSDKTPFILGTFDPAKSLEVDIELSGLENFSYGREIFDHFSTICLSAGVPSKSNNDSPIWCMLVLGSLRDNEDNPVFCSEVPCNAPLGVIGFGSDASASVKSSRITYKRCGNNCRPEDYCGFRRDLNGRQPVDNGIYTFKYDGRFATIIGPLGIIREELIYKDTLWFDTVVSCCGWERQDNVFRLFKGAGILSHFGVNAKVLDVRVIEKYEGILDGRCPQP